MTKSVTLADVARKSKVSLSTASLVLRDKPGIPPETRKRVLNAAQALGYQLKPRKRAATPSAQVTLHNLGLVIKIEPDMPPHANPFYSQVLAGIEEACRRRKINLMYATLPVDEDNYPLEVPRLLTENHVDGFLLVGIFVNEAFMRLLGSQAAPIVLVDAYSNFNAYDAVVSDNLHGAYEAVRYLISLGHQHIGFVGAHPQAYPSLHERRQGYLQALQDQGIATSYVANSEMTPDSDFAAATDLLQRYPSVTAVMGCNDNAALATIRALQVQKRAVPGDVSVMGFDDIDVASHVTPTLTTMHVDKVSMERMAVQLLGNRLEFPLFAVLKRHPARPG